MQKAGITKEAGLQQMQAYTADETFKFTQDMLTANPDMRGHVHPDRPADASARCAPSRRPIATARFSSPPSTAFRSSSTFCKKGEIVASGMQQPYLMGVKSGRSADRRISTARTPEKQILVPIVVVTSKNIDEILPTIKETVFANEVK